jgi:hypothetical protein
MRRTALAAAAALASLVLAGSLSGCGVALVDPAATDAAPAPTTPSRTPAAPASPTPTASAPAAGDSTADDSTVTSDLPYTRDDFVAAATATIACTPGLVISQPGAVVVVEGACGDVTVNADAAVVVLDDVDRLRVTGVGTVVSALATGSIEVGGDANVIWWRGAAPTVTDTGAGNVIEREP